jgi:hypothetical protein
MMLALSNEDSTMVVDIDARRIIKHCGCGRATVSYFLAGVGICSWLRDGIEKVSDDCLVEEIILSVEETVILRKNCIEESDRNNHK